MKKKAFIFASLVFVLALSFVYLQYGNLSADDNPTGKKDCSSECTKSKDNTSASNTEEMSDDLSVYEFTTDKVSCEGSKGDMKSSLLKVSGVKNVEFGETCNVSHQTKVKLFYSAGETSVENIESSLTEYGVECSSKTGSKTGSCDKNKKTSKTGSDI